MRFSKVFSDVVFRTVVFSFVLMIGTHCLGATTTVVLSNSVVSTAAAGTTNVVFADTNSGASVTVAVSMTAYSSSNATPSFTFLDTFGPGGKPVHLGVQSGLGGGDGNWVDFFEGADFSATLVSATAAVDTNSIAFGIVSLGLRPGNGNRTTWTSSATSATNTVFYGAEQLYALDTNTFALSGGVYGGHLRNVSGTQYQISDNVNADYKGLVLVAKFVTTVTQGASAILVEPSYSNNQMQFTVIGTEGANYIVQANADLNSTTWTSVATNVSPFVFTHTNMATQSFYRAIAQ